MSTPLEQTEPCPICHDEFTIAVGPRDEFGNQDSDDCPCQLVESDEPGAR